MLDLFEVAVVLALWHNRATQERESDGSVAGSDASWPGRTEDHNAISARFFMRVCSVATGVTGCPLQALTTFYVEVPFDPDGNMVSHCDAVTNWSELRAPHPPRFLRLPFPEDSHLVLSLAAFVAHMRDLQHTATPLIPGTSISRRAFA